MTIKLTVFMADKRINDSADKLHLASKVVTPGVRSTMFQQYAQHCARPS